MALARRDICTPKGTWRSPPAGHPGRVARWNLAAGHARFKRWKSPTSWARAETGSHVCYDESRHPDPGSIYAMHMTTDNKRTGDVHQTRTDDDRWILDVAPDDRAQDVAIRSVQARLKWVQYYLPLAARRPEEDLEYVHQLRVATRRTVAAVRLYRDFLPRQPRKKLCRELKRIRRAAGGARDCDVLIQRHEPSAQTPRARKFLDSVYKKRRQAQQPLCDAYASAIEHQGLQELTDQILQSVSDKAGDQQAPRFDRWARRQLRRCARTFFAAEPEELDNLEALHRLRLCGKDLRYAMELLGAAFPQSMRLQLYPLIEQLQDRLGAINDHAVAVERFKKWRKDTPQARQRKHIKELVQTEKELLAKSLWEFARWWTPKRSKRIQRRFRDYANGPS